MQVARLGGMPRHPYSFWPPVSVRLISGLQITSLRKILILEKSYVNLTLYRSLKVKNTQNREFMFYIFITKIRGIIEKSPKTMQNKDITLYVMQIQRNRSQKTTKFMYAFYVHHLLTIYRLGLRCVCRILQCKHKCLHHWIVDTCPRDLAVTLLRNILPFELPNLEASQAERESCTRF